MKKILFISSSNLSPNNYSGDTIRANNIIKVLRKKNIVDTISFGNKNIINKITNLDKQNINFIFKKYNFFLRILLSVQSLINLKPMQNGFFFSKSIKNLVNKNYKKYNTIICHLTRSSQYLPTNFSGTKVLEMTDLMSNNYVQTKKHLKLYNPFYYLYLIESFLISRYEKYCFKLFDKIILVSKKDIVLNSKLNKKKLKFIINGIDINKKKFNFNKNNNKIIFIGNIDYLPNKDACLYFAKKILPHLNILHPNLELHIVGKISFFNKLSFIFSKNVRLLGKVNKLDNVIKNTICGISNLRIATGIQNKILTYGSYGLPTLCSLKSTQGLLSFKSNRHLITYKNNNEFINKINLIKSSSKVANKISKNIYLKTKDMSWDKILKGYQAIV